jgi:hypothetical protein
MRIRTVKPGFFLNEELADLEHETGLPVRVAFVGLWCAADREGRFEWRPRRLKAAVLPYDDVDFSRVLDALATRGFLVRYASQGREYGSIPTFTEHQIVNARESASKLPAPPATPCNDTETTRAPRVDDACPTREVHARGEGKGREQEGKEETREGAPDLSPPERAGLPRDPMADHFRGKAPGQREDVRQLHAAWKLAVRLPEAKIRGARDPDAVTLAEVLDLHGLEDCLRVAHHAPQDGMVSGRLDDKGVKHPSIRYIFGNADAFLRILHAAREAEGKGSGRLPAHEALARARAL